MSFVVTLLADPLGTPISDAEVEEARGTLGRAGAEPGRPDWLAPGIACDLAFAGLAPEAAETALRVAFDGRPIDLGAQPLAGRRKRLLVADMESTIIAQEMLDELAERLNLRAEISAITERAMRGELDFEEALAERVARLAGLELATLEAAAAAITLNPGATELIGTMKAGGAETALVSGGFRYFAEPIAAALGFDHCRANSLEIEQGRLSGRTLGPILGREAKLQTLNELLAARGLAADAACAVGDGANDLAMLRAAGLGVAYRAKPVVRAAAPFRLDHADLTGLLYLQGYRRDEFVSAGN
ncbi:phosphoserine phosphatase [Tistlia consotensis]|uniref:Phosphoserine phosphatase n=1 Tax=Tistlia consotensis USBA 355 TaxID=560819 RepID=A0A1Y6B8Q9_9PROT|nr:phosphoserine phosphatase SerB [Tistlia consotensis]SME91341.1 phosphoserine phosphatase [Tistlia consotensis USBA 355]SNR27328.1 phosphoserine phosphatase [Tistlia consotensis]